MLIASIHQAAADDGCASFKWDIHREHALFTGPATPQTAAAGATGAPSLALDRLYEITLTPQDGVTYPVPPGKKMLTDGAFGGTVAFSVPSAGAYRVALDGPFWIDVVGGGQLTPTKDFGGPQHCEGGPRKLVEFELRAGTPYLLQMSAASSAHVKVAITSSSPATH
jgi:hypothetical protein